MTPIHPGRILKRELSARNLSANRMALALRVPSGRIVQILNGKRAVSPETALRLARFFGTSADFWMSLQARYDLAVAEKTIGDRISAEVERIGNPAPVTKPKGAKRPIKLRSSDKLASAMVAEDRR